MLFANTNQKQKQKVIVPVEVLKNNGQINQEEEP